MQEETVLLGILDGMSRCTSLLQACGIPVVSTRFAFTKLTSMNGLDKAKGAL
jgi:hypothetical protein